MKVTDIAIHQFLGIESLEMHFQNPINIIVGINEAGKSSIRDACKWCLTGQARDLKTHQEQAALIREGGKAAEVTITLEGTHKLTRRKTPKSPATFQGADNLTKVSPAILCDPYTFLTLPEGMRREMFFKLIPGLNPSQKQIYDRLIQLFSENNATGVDQVGIIEDMAALASKGFKAAENEAVTRRREAKRVKDSLVVPEPEKEFRIGDRPYDLSAVDTDRITATMETLQKDRDELIMAKGRHEEALSAKARIERELSVARNTPPPGPSGNIEQLEATLKKTQEELKEARANLLDLQGTPSKVFPAKCPVPYLMVPCPNAGQEIVLGKAPASPAEIEQAEAKCTELSGLATTQARELTAVKEAEATSRAHQEKIARLEGELKQAEASAAETLPSDIDEQIATIDHRLGNGRTLLAEVREYRRLVDQATEAQNRLTQTDQEIHLYDFLAKALAPNGIPSQMIVEALGPVNYLLERAAEYLFPGRPLCLTPELGIDLGGSPYTTLSKSAKFRVGIAFQYVLAKLAGDRLLMIDEADILDQDNRINLMRFALANKADFDTIMIFATAPSVPPPVAGAQVWWMENGTANPV